MYVRDKKSFTYVEKSSPNALRLVQQKTENNGIESYVDKTKLPDRFKNKIEKPCSITINPDQPLSFYQDKEFIGNSVIILNHENLSRSFAFFVISAINKIREGSLWSNKFPKNVVEKTTIKLPTKNGKIDFDFMESFIAELDAQRIAELDAYLTVAGLKDYELTDEEINVLKEFDNIEWSDVKFDEVFNNIKQGRRLKKADHIEGDIPFVMSGVTNTGVCNYISNPIIMFPKNSITVDIFGNTFYRNYDFSAGDDTGVYWNDKKRLSENVLLFISASVGKSLLGKFSYGHKLRSSRSKKFLMKLPFNKGKIDFIYMEILTQAIKKLVIKDVVLYADKKIDATKKVVWQK